MKNKIALIGLLFVFSYYGTSRSDDYPTLTNDGWIRVNPSGGVPNPGVHGGNRRVTSTGNYGGVRGTFSNLMNFNLGKFYVSDKYNAQGDLLEKGQNSNSNKPSVYLGGSGRGFEIDAGAQYEALYKDSVPAGWSIFTAVTIWDFDDTVDGEKYFNWYQPAVRVPELNSLVLDFQQSKNGAINLYSKYTDSGGTEVHLPQPVKIIRVQGQPDRPVNPTINPLGNRPVTTSTMTIKRIVALTQASTSTTDGAKFENILFEGGEIRKWTTDGNGNDILDIPSPWTSGSHAYLPRSANEGYEKAKTWPDGSKGPIFHVDSEYPWSRNKDGSDSPDTPIPPGANNKSRYERETVSIEMLSGKSKIVPKPKAAARSSK